MSHKKNNSIIIPRITQKNFTKALTDNVFRNLLRSDSPVNVSNPYPKVKHMNPKSVLMNQKNANNACNARTAIFGDKYQTEKNVRENRYIKKEGKHSRYDTNMDKFTTVII